VARDGGATGDEGAAGDGGGEALECGVLWDGHAMGDGGGGTVEQGGRAATRRTSEELGDKCGMARFNFFSGPTQHGEIYFFGSGQTDTRA